jgi:cold-inducible RNA-binding protein
MSVRLFVGNLSYDVTESDLRDLFSPVGPLSTVIIPMDRETGKPRGFAFVEFSDQAQAEEAIHRFNNQPLKGRNITINEARAREPRPGGGAYRPASAPRTSMGNMEMGVDSMDSTKAGRSERRNRNFGRDAKPSRKRRNNYGSKGESSGRRGPIRERGGGQFFGDVDDEDFEDDRDDKFKW